ncbi:hypothetical protein SERLA73DRAFT_69514 [Serpula lacrymans var. lacrymans S7.3]|uniref:BTB domain-containing protein n=1 Tax=Serpula lacrymans var. lacrymans (strain S7.3) TaxID=936435 RepID=F8PL20_SERL3|nr:hypothetical protein SERLA73DRAFT_69514 [Serpula lacrymans var. lacrymans S7.3]
MAPNTSPPGIHEATQNSTSAWQNNLQSLFHHAKDRFPDVVWELIGEHDDKSKDPEEVWGHKVFVQRLYDAHLYVPYIDIYFTAIVYARAPPSFQARYFSFRPPPVASPVPYPSSPSGTIPAQSTLSLPELNGTSRSPSPFRGPSPSPSTSTGAILRLPTSINPALFSNELEYLYTGKGLGQAFEFLFDTSENREEGDGEESRIDKLRKDLVFMWRSRLYSDVRIALTGSFSSTNHESATAIFSSHRFILVSRSPYFHAQLLSWGSPTKAGEPLTLNLPSPPFTPASLHFTLGFIYTGTLVFSHRSYDLDTAFHIMRSATYLSLDSLYDEIQARIVQEMMHGLFHAFLEFAEYERITGGKWGTGGCRCRQCARRAPRVLEFALSDDVKNSHLERGARRALVGLFGEGWCLSEFAMLPQKVRDSLLKGLAKRTTPLNVFALLFAAQHAMHKLDAIIDAWADISREMILAARKTIDDVLCSHPECFEQPDWLEIMEGDGVNFDDGERVSWVMDAVRRGISEKHAGTLYQTLVGNILLRPHATDNEMTMLSTTSAMREKVEETRVEVLRWLRKRWLSVRQESGFDNLEGWALKEISSDIEVPVEDLVSPAPTRMSPARVGPRASLSKVEADSDTMSVHSLRASVLSRNIGKHGGTSHRDQTLASSSASIRSVARSTISKTSRVHAVGTPSRSHDVRPDSKLSPSSASSVSTATRTSVGPPERSHKRTSSQSDANGRPTPSKLIIGQHNAKTKSLVPSVASSVRSRTSTIRNSASTTLRVPSGGQRPTSSLSTSSDASSAFKTANSELTPTSATRSRRTSTTSTISNVSVKTISKTPRTRQLSGVSSTSTATSVSKIKRTGTGTSVPNSPVDPSKLLPPQVKRTISSTSAKSTSSVKSSNAVKSTVRKTTVPEKGTNGTPTISPTETKPPTSPDDKGKSKEIIPEELSEQSKENIPPSTVVQPLKRKGSADTIKTSTPPTEKTVALVEQNMPPAPLGSTLDIGIPCIISSKRKRFRAFARYIGEVQGEQGPWVGVEVPLGDGWGGDALEGRQWNDGTWGGVKYFEMGGNGSEWDFGDDRAARRRKMDWIHGTGRDKGLKREGDQLTVNRTKRLRSASPAVSDASNAESRGLFVRPQQVLYVVDAVGADL